MFEDQQKIRLLPFEIHHTVVLGCVKNNKKSVEGTLKNLAFLE